MKIEIENYYKDKIRAIDAKVKAQEIAFSPMTFQAIRALIELGLLQKISDAGDDGISIRQLSKASGVSEYGVGVLAEMALGMGVLKLNGKEDPEEGKSGLGMLVLGKIGFFLLEDDLTKANFYFTMQHELLGLGHAVLQAKEFIKNENFIVCCGDDICTYEGDAPSKQLIEAFKKTNGHTIVGGQKVKHEMISKYGCMDINREESARLYSLKGIVEKPNIEEAPSDLASLGKWVFNSKIFDYIEKTPKGKGGEIQLTDAIALMIKDEPVYFYDFVGKRYDCGDKLGYLKAIVDVALKRDDLKDSFKEFLKEKDFR